MEEASLMVLLLSALILHSIADDGDFDVRQHVSTVTRYGVVKDISDNSLVPSNIPDQCSPIHLNLVHLALVSEDIFRTLREMRRRSGVGGFEFIPSPLPTYYRNLKKKVRDVLSDKQIKEAEELGILDMAVSLCNDKVLDMAERGNKASIDMDQCLTWLDSKEPYSVIYVCFGGLCVFPESQLIEIGLGLEASDCNFIWVIKEGFGDGLAIDDLDDLEERERFSHCLSLSPPTVTTTVAGHRPSPPSHVATAIAEITTTTAANHRFVTVAFGYNSTLRGGYITHHEYIQVGKERDVGMNQISLFEAKVANGNGEQTLSRDVYQLGCRFDFYRMLSFYFTTVGFYFSSMVTVLTVYVFLYGRLYLVLSGIEKRVLENASIRQSKALEEALATQSVFQLGLLLVLPMVMEIGLERGFRTALGDFVIMQLQLASGLALVQFTIGLDRAVGPVEATTGPVVKI
ncbi:hypothetical protein HYC85_000308 [Camellia sinensis]|uniref:Glycosyl transferase 48 domain-containing protein n=1 Tax=Camellia sinensis TaxID=4442 RepID=A0A7J7I2E2_CAMSI|nr:hypothetical protein HYC85_000308 [Camellia sinensis]